ncbi:IS66 family transposase zinc-finger binding domain-containing protein [Microvenator marinus]|nr:IS66 family transposase zinc-finger binding domain-containing protein [Microvenator marinus]
MRWLSGESTSALLKRDLNASQKKKETPEERAKRLERSKEKREKTRQSRRDETPTEIVEHAIVETECAQCGGSLEAADDLSPEVSEEYEYVPARVIRREHHRERKVCKCGCFAIGRGHARTSDQKVHVSILRFRGVVPRSSRAGVGWFWPADRLPG